MEKLIQITEYNLLGKLPDPFLFNDGSRVKDVSDWTKRREEIYDSAITLQYGTMPPEPEFVDVFALYRGGKGKLNCYQIRTGRKEKPVQFTMTVILPKEKPEGTKALRRIAIGAGATAETPALPEAEELPIDAEA